MGLNFYTIFGATDQRIGIWWSSLTLTLCHNWEKIETRSNNCSIGLHYICITMAAMMCSVFNHQVYPIKGKKEFLPGDAYAKDLAWWFIFLPVTLITRQFRDRILWCPEQMANWGQLVQNFSWHPLKPPMLSWIWDCPLLYKCSSLTLKNVSSKCIIFAFVETLGRDNT